MTHPVKKEAINDNPGYLDFEAIHAYPFYESDAQHGWMANTDSEHLIQMSDPLDPSRKVTATAEHHFQAAKANHIIKPSNMSDTLQDEKRDYVDGIFDHARPGTVSQDKLSGLPAKSRALMQKTGPLVLDSTTWDFTIAELQAQKHEVMLEILKQKLIQHPHLIDELLKTNPGSIIVEASGSNDASWGIGGTYTSRTPPGTPGKGTNHLGILWTAIRNQLIANSSPDKKAQINSLNLSDLQPEIQKANALYKNLQQKDSWKKTCAQTNGFLTTTNPKQADGTPNPSQNPLVFPKKTTTIAPTKPPIKPSDMPDPAKPASTATPDATDSKPLSDAGVTTPSSGTVSMTHLELPYIMDAPLADLETSNEKEKLFSSAKFDQKSDSVTITTHQNAKAVIKKNALSLSITGSKDATVDTIKNLYLLNLVKKGDITLKEGKVIEIKEGASFKINPNRIRLTDAAGTTPLPHADRKEMLVKLDKQLIEAFKDHPDFYQPMDFSDIASEKINARFGRPVPNLKIPTTENKTTDDDPLKPFKP